MVELLYHSLSSIRKVTQMINVHCEVVDNSNGFMWRIVAEAGALGKYIGDWQRNYSSFAILKAPTGEDGRLQTWIAGSSYWSTTSKTLGEFPEFTPISVGDDVGTKPVLVDCKNISIKAVDVTHDIQLYL